MNYGNHNYWGYENSESNSYATPNNYNYYNCSPPPPSHNPYCYIYPPPPSHEPYCYNNPPPTEQDSRLEQILIALDAQNKLLQSMNASFQDRKSTRLNSSH